MTPLDGRGRAAAAGGVFLLATISFVPVARILRYALVGDSGRGIALIFVVSACIVLALLYERLVRGTLYGSLQRALPVGAAAPTIALLGGLIPAAVRLFLLPRGPAPLPVLAGHAFLVEVGLGLALALLSLGTGSTVSGGIAYGLVWSVRFGLVLSFRGGVVPMMELAAAWIAPIAVALVLARPLRPWREELLG
ncbi:MAG: hypothetical protein ACHQPI_02280 [Thermoanaerobaculia bacterium]